MPKKMHRLRTATFFAACAVIVILGDITGGAMLIIVVMVGSAPFQRPPTDRRQE